jgi:hypothetical protein
MKEEDIGESYMMNFVNCAPPTINMIKQKRIRWAGQVARMSERLDNSAGLSGLRRFVDFFSRPKIMH